MPMNNSGHCNSGNWNSGHHNSGNRNSGNRNSGHHNSGNWNSGHHNSGNWNSGHHNSGNWNSGHHNSGCCNSSTPKVRMFNKETDFDFGDVSFPDYFYFSLITWVNEADMTEKEKDAYPSYVTCGGYLKCRSYKQAWRESWDCATDEDKRKTMELPNWDNEVFKEISGIDVEKELSCNGNKKKAEELRKQAEEMLAKAKELENNL